MSNRPLNVGLIGGGKGAFIVQPHQKAIHFDGTRRVVAGALFPDPRIALEEAAKWPYPIKGYGSYDEMINVQKDLPADQKLDYVLIVTPNHVHFDPALKAVQAGIPVFCEKPLTVNLEEASALVKAVKDKNIPFGVAHTYLGHWTSRLSRYIVRSGLLGDIRWVDSYYLQGWLATKVEATGVQQAVWRTNPKMAGGSGCGGDGSTVGTGVGCGGGVASWPRAACARRAITPRHVARSFQIFMSPPAGAAGCVWRSSGSARALSRGREELVLLEDGPRAWPGRRAQRRSTRGLWRAARERPKKDGTPRSRGARGTRDRHACSCRSKR